MNTHNRVGLLSRLYWFSPDFSATTRFQQKETMSMYKQATYPYCAIPPSGGIWECSDKGTWQKRNLLPPDACRCTLWMPSSRSPSRKTYLSWLQFHLLWETFNTGRFISSLLKAPGDIFLMPLLVINIVCKILSFSSGFHPCHAEELRTGCVTRHTSAPQHLQT